MMKNVIVIGVSLVLVSNFLGCMFGLISIFFTPILIGVFTILVLSNPNYQLPVKFLMIIGMIIINDILVKLFAGGDHDFPGQGWITLFLFFGLGVATILIVLYGLFVQKKDKIVYFLSFGASCGLIILYLHQFDTFGMVYGNPASNEKEVSQANGLFITDIYLPEDSVEFGTAKIKIVEGWYEKQTRVNHFGLTKRTELTGKVNCIIHFDKAFDIVHFNINDSSINGAKPVRNCAFPIDDLPQEINLYFFDDNDTTDKYKKIQLKTNSL